MFCCLLVFKNVKKMYSSVDDDPVYQEIVEILPVSYSSTAKGSDEENFLNTRDRTLALIELYKKYKPKVGTFEVKSMKRLWEVVARDFSNNFKITVTAARCENRWKTLERNYKKTIDNNNKTGRDRKVFEYEEQFDNIYGKKKSITPTVLLSSNSTITATSGKDRITILDDRRNDSTQLPICSSIPEDESGSSEPINIQEFVQNIEETPSLPQNTPRTTKRKRSVRTVSSTYKSRNEILLEMKNDLKKYYEEKSKREEQILQWEIKKYEERKKRTKLLEIILGDNLVE